MLPQHTNCIEMGYLRLILGCIKPQASTPSPASCMVFVAPLLAIRLTRVLSTEGCYGLGRRRSVSFSVTNWDLKD